MPIAAIAAFSSAILRTLELRFEDRAVAVGTDAVAQLRLGVMGNVGLDSLPVILIVANALAVHANRQYLPQLGQFSQRRLQFANELFALLLRALALRDVPGRGVNELVIHVRNCVPAKPAVRTVFAHVAIFKAQSLSPTSDDAVLFERAFAIVGMNELEHPL